MRAWIVRGEPISRLIRPSRTRRAALVSASFDGGTAWTTAAVTGQGDRYHAHFTAPADSDVTLRVVAVNAAGAEESETITSAYTTGS
ncbi:MAG TPA: hypothetical protein VGH27_29315 [Streptosporangiaceae bacterium]|jgi:hypothetical protein